VAEVPTALTAGWRGPHASWGGNCWYALGAIACFQAPALLKRSSPLSAGWELSAERCTRQGTGAQGKRLYKWH